jgi:hypothetical protein
LANKTIIDASFIREAWRPSPAALHYGLFWWRWGREDPRIGPVHFANGIKGQRIFVVPKRHHHCRERQHWFAPLFRPCRATD